MEILTHNPLCGLPIKTLICPKVTRGPKRNRRKLTGVQCFRKIEKNNVPCHKVCLEL